MPKKSLYTKTQMNKSYLQITESCTLLDFKEVSPNWFVETWLDENFAYDCHWLPQNQRILPTTIKQYDYS